MNLEGILGLLNDKDLGKLSSQLGVNENDVKLGLVSALPAILQALNKNTQTAEGAESLNKALEKHDGSVLNNLSGYLNNPDLNDGAGILNHLFGNQTENVAKAVSKSSGLDSNGSIKMLQILAPLVLGALGKQKKDNNLDASGLDALTSMLALNLGSNEQTSGIMGLVTNLLDSNKDGAIVDDLLGLASKFLGGKK
ncbi:MAG: DUF937 domain-containing protein [Leptotrichiaceae bacterium]|jgi:hypothetical protein|nr:DUF937 domain-containing protein [Leptotrichiaceae bacterium]MBP6280450.1 DUF937 domain-containing protein [Leptotrichiaceae bacterium]MBP7099957.1 DUF937 domain-containing protein [Leptotrichiaceae bacterium]MBP7725298.1 DUF937 domain-containing protein [Leptotrichiaceae bacterium]MBP9629074.1 DUF937 domain-containing protein [Leptotrichiaceae bacterium]